MEDEEQKRVKLEQLIENMGKDNLDLALEILFNASKDEVP